MQETPQEYRSRMLGCIGGQDPLKIQAATPQKLERLLKGVPASKLRKRWSIARPPRAVGGGNVETSQRIVDTLLRALARALPQRIPAASQGTLNNLTLGGADMRRGHSASPFAYYETIVSGTGARPGHHGLSGIRNHMTNSFKTPVEVLEITYPVRVRRSALRRSSGGRGKYRGGDGIVRGIELLADAQLSLLSDCRTIAPYGLNGGASDAKGKSELVVRGRRKKLPSRCSLYAPAGAVIRIEIPRGGGWRAL